MMACPAAKRSRRNPVVVSTMRLPSLARIESLAVGKDGTIFVGSDTALFVISTSGILSLHAGHPSTSGFKDGQGHEARFDVLAGLAVDRGGDVLVVDKGTMDKRPVYLQPCVSCGQVT